MTPAQLASIKADVLAQPDLAEMWSIGSPGGVADAYNAIASPDFFVWQTAVPASDIMDAITWANFTPADAPDGTQTWMNRSLACQGKQFNIQTLLVGRETINASRANIRNGLQDALTAIPSGAGGTNKSGGWTTVQTAIQRKATRLEKLLATGTGSSASPATMTFEGAIGYTTIIEAMNT